MLHNKSGQWLLKSKFVEQQENHEISLNCALISQDRKLK